MPDDAPDDANPAIDGSESAGSDAADEAAGDDARTVPHLADQGKDVVDARGEDLGIVSDVDGETLYVEPDPTLVEKVLSTLHWREGERGEMKVPAERVLRIDDDVVLDVDRETEFREEP